MDDFNLSQFDDDFAGATVEPKKFDPVPDGKYQVNVDKVELAHAKTTGSTMLKWTLKLIAGKQAGRLLWRNNVMATRENVKWLKGDLHTCGLELERLSDLQANLEKLLDVKLEVTKRTKGENANIYFNKRIVVADTPARGHSGGDDDLSF
jgi:hypothetical protein